MKNIIIIALLLMGTTGCFGPKRQICEIKDEEHDLYFRKFNLPLKKVGKIIKGVNLLVDYEKEWEGKKYFRVNNYFWAGQTPSVESQNVKASLWIETESCKGGAEGLEYQEYDMMGIYFSMQKDIKSKNRLQPLMKIYFLDSNRVLIVGKRTLPLGRLKKDDTTYWDIHLYGTYSKDKNGNFDFNFATVNEFVVGQYFSHGFIVPTISEEKIKPLNISCMKEGEYYKCTTTNYFSSNHPDYGYLSKDWFIEFNYEDFDPKEDL